MIAEIIMNSSVRNLDRTFDYIIPIDMEEKVHIGSRVLVKFGNIKELKEGFVINIKEKSEFEVKDIAKVEERDFIDVPKVKLANWMAKRYFCNVSDCIKLMLPPGTGTDKFANRAKEKTERFVKLSKEINEIEFDIENKKIKSDKQKRALEFLIKNNEISSKDLENFADVSTSILKTLEKNGYIKFYEQTVERNPFIHKVIDSSSKLNLNDEQKSAYDAVEEAIDDCMNSEFLLFGVTGSGKTEVYLQLIEKVLNIGKTSVMLVPEISLTPQTVDRFIARFGQDKIAILHSKLSVGERYDQWYKIKNGEAKIVIGARSAIFAPISDLGLIIIDEEHDSSYKSEMTPRYNVKDVSRYLAKEYNVPIVFGSATPDMDTFYKAQQGEIELLELTKRANNAELPTINIVDMKQELANGNRSSISMKLYENIKENLSNKKQTILFLNRRGYSTFILCRDCGYVAKCKHCNIALTYHIKENKLKCHYCGYEEIPRGYCPECKSKNIKYSGSGTQKLEEEINKRVCEIAEQISKDYEGKEVRLICILKGSVFYTCELAKRITIPVTLDFMSVSSYGSGTVSSGTIKIKKDLDDDIEGLDVIVVEDIIDSGNTLSRLIPMLKERKPASLKITTLLDKPDRREVDDVTVDYVGFEIEDKFVVGYGLDYDQSYRDLPYIGVIE